MVNAESWLDVSRGLCNQLVKTSCLENSLPVVIFDRLDQVSSPYKFLVFQLRVFVHGEIIDVYSLILDIASIDV